MPASPPVEIELKLGLPAEAVPRVLRHAAVLAAKRGRAQRERLVATYFDTPDLALARQRLALRIRREGTRWIQTIKGPPPPGGPGAPGRTEIECPLATGTRRPPLSRQALLDTPWRAQLERLLDDGALQPAFTTDYERTTVPLAFDDGTLAVLCVDVGEVRAGPRGSGGRRAPICEVEIELESGDPRRLFDLAVALAGDLPLVAEPSSKAERGCVLLAPDMRSPARARRTALPEDASAAGALAQIVGECVEQIERNVDGVLHRHDPEYVHQLRVGTRRLRSALVLARPHVPDEPLARLASEARWLAQALGEVRELDVLLGETLAPLQDAGHGASGSALAPLVAPLAKQAGSRRRTAQRVAREALRSPRFLRLLLDLGAWRATPLLGADPAGPGGQALAAPARTFARDVLARRHRKLLSAGDRLAEATAEERHAVRIAAKRMRYAAEFFASCFPDKRVRAFVDALAGLQDVLGLGNDETVALAWSSRLAGAAAPSTFALAGWAFAQARHREGELAKAWKRLAGARPFWR